jgi:hypothetical protein
MQLRLTMMVLSKENDLVCLEIYTASKVQPPGFWNIETNHVLLSPEVYSYFRSLRTQKQQKVFFDSLKKVSFLLLAKKS